MVWYVMFITSPVLQHLLIRTAANAVSSNGGINNPTNIRVHALQQGHPSAINELCSCSISQLFRAHDEKQ